MKSYITTLFYQLQLDRAISLFIQGYILGSRYSRFAFRRFVFRRWLNRLGAVGAWSFACVLGACGCGVLWVCVWLLLWLADDAGMVM